jgi:DNA-binding NarL/FixJ family response regulator
VDDGAPIRVLVADDHPVVRGGLVALLRTIPDLAVVGEVSDGDSAIREVQLLRPDVVLMDVRMPGLDGVEATRRIRSAVPETRVLMLTMYDDDATVFTAMQAGAQGYLLKEAELVRAIRAVVAGEAIFGARVAGRVLSYFAERTAETGTSYPFPELTERERVVLALLARGRSTRDIALELFLSPKTVSNNLTAVFAKLQVAGRSEAIVRAHERGVGGLT